LVVDLRKRKPPSAKRGRNALVEINEWRGKVFVAGRACSSGNLNSGTRTQTQEELAGPDPGSITGICATIKEKK